MNTAMPGKPQDQAAFTYNSAADSFDAPALSFWNYFGRQTIELLSLQRGSRVLDVCCGTGASAIPAAESVGQTGKVMGVDLSQKLLELAKKKATQRGLTNIDFEPGDMLQLKFQSESFDAVVCVFGIFFVPEMHLAVRELWRSVRAGGKLAITTWGPNFFDPASEGFWQSIKEARPDLHKAFNPWDRITEPGSLQKILTEGGVESPRITAENRLHPINSAEDWWTIVLGSGYRGTIEQLRDSELKQVQEANLHFIKTSKITAIETNVLYAIATKPLAEIPNET